MELEIIVRNDNRKDQNEIISKIRDLINLKNLEPGDKLPSERMLVGKFGISRNNIREAIQKMEFYGLLKCVPQSGTFIADIGVVALNGMVDDILNLEVPSFKSLVETRILLELKSADLAASRRTDEDLQKIEDALDAYEAKVLIGEDAVQEDLLFHLAIACSSGNSTLNTLMLHITPEIITNFKKFHVCDDGKALLGIKEHRAIFDAIKRKDSKETVSKLKIHFNELYQYCNITDS